MTTCSNRLSFPSRSLVSAGSWKLEASNACEISLNQTQLEVMQESLGAACHYIAPPMTAATTAVEMLLQEVRTNHGPLEEQLTELKHWIKARGDEIHRLENLNVYQTMDYACGIRIIDSEAGSQLMLRACGQDPRRMVYRTRQR